MDFKSSILEKITKWLVGGDLFTFIQNEVAVMSNHEMTGEEKRERVIADAKDFAADSAIFIINLAIEVAVTILKRKAARYEHN